MQLPPTSFFRRSLEDAEELEEEEEESTDSFEGRESILDVMVGQVGPGVSQRYLSVHYRSRCESLIRFSNHAFYEDRLLTFPNPTPDDANVRDVYLPTATYDSGGTRTNREEAERVVEIVLELMANLPSDESVGVVALSRAQADLIEDLVERRRLQHRHLEFRFSEDSPERFFVKNLENVQGDERDHMILSIGYGPTPAGSVPNRFGPINSEGGQRRLNVAVTRARKTMTVVHSLRPEDITSPQPGARQLRRYLEYVRNPNGSFDSEIVGTGEPESPFEEAVLAALRRRGHEVDAQIGVSGYRIDLAIKSEDGKAYDLGIECDGATYHSTPTARDRDWLRQQVLEGLGWNIHRVWSTSWSRDPQTEINAIEQALQNARNGVRASSSTPESPSRDLGRQVSAARAERVGSRETREPTSSDAVKVPRPRPVQGRQVSHVPSTEIDEGLLHVARASYGIEREELMRETARYFGWARTGQEIKRRFTSRINRLIRDGLLVEQGDMLVASEPTG